MNSMTRGRNANANFTEKHTFGQFAGELQQKAKGGTSARKEYFSLTEEQASDGSLRENDSPLATEIRDKGDEDTPQAIKVINMVESSDTVKEINPLDQLVHMGGKASETPEFNAKMTPAEILTRQPSTAQTSNRISQHLNFRQSSGPYNIKGRKSKGSSKDKSKSRERSKGKNKQLTITQGSSKPQKGMKKIAKKNNNYPYNRSNSLVKGNDSGRNKFGITQGSFRQQRQQLSTVRSQQSQKSNSINGEQQLNALSSFHGRQQINQSMNNSKTTINITNKSGNTAENRPTMLTIANSSAETVPTGFKEREMQK